MLSKFVYVTVVAAALTGSLLFVGCNSSGASAAPKPTEGTAAAAEVYTCPMHPEVTDTKPGTCPKCGMTLEKKKK